MVPASQDRVAGRILAQRAGRHAGQYEFELVVAVVEVFEEHAGATGQLGIVVDQLDAIVHREVKVGVAAACGQPDGRLLLALSMLTLTTA